MPKKGTAGGVVLMSANSVDGQTLAQRKFRTGELVHLSFSVLRRNLLLFTLAGVMPLLPWLAGALRDSPPIIRGSSDDLRSIGFSLLGVHVGLGDVTEILLRIVFEAISSATAISAAFQNLRGIQLHIGDAFRGGA
jgi:hypothetical protein